MDRAFDLTRERHIPAIDAERHHGYVCPCCCQRVFLRRGHARSAHFAHKEPSPLCEEYHPGSGVRFGDSHVGSSASPLLLSLNPGDHSWSLFLEFESLVVAEQERLGRSILTFDGLVAETTGGSTRKVRADSLLPGSGAARIALDPSTASTRVRTIGPWPKHIGPDRWRFQVPGLAPRGALFAQCRPRVFRRHDWTSRVGWGDDIVVVGLSLADPPAGVRCTPLTPITTREGTWHAMLIRLPRSKDPACSRWLARFGVVPSKRTLKSRLLSPPIEYGPGGRPRFYVSEGFLVQPSPNARVLAAEAHSTFNARSVERPTNEPASLYSVTSEEAGPLRVRSDVSNDGIHVDIVTSSADDRPIGHPWVLRYDGTELHPYSTHRVTSHVATELSLISADALLRFSVTAVTRTGRSDVIHEADSHTATEWMQQHLPTVSELEVDAGNLGFLRLQVETPNSIVQEGTLHPTDTKRMTWATAYELSTNQYDDVQLPHWTFARRRKSKRAAAPFENGAS